MRHRVLVDLAQSLREMIEICAMQVDLRDLVAELGNLQHSFERLELCKQLLVHLSLPVDHVVAQLDFLGRHRLELIVLFLQLVVLLFHVFVELVLFFAHKALIKIYHSVELSDLVTLFFDPIRVLLRQLEIESGHIVDGGTFLVLASHFFFEARDLG